MSGSDEEIRNKVLLLSIKVHHAHSTTLLALVLIW